MCHDPHGLILTAVVDDEPFDTLETEHLARQGVEGEAKGLGLVVAGDLDDEFQDQRCARSRASAVTGVASSRAVMRLT